MSRGQISRGAAVGLLCLIGLLVPSTARAQVVLDEYLGDGLGSLRDQTVKIAAIPPAQRDPGLIANLLPHSNPIQFARMIAASEGLAAELAELDARRLNKMIANAPGANGTALLSKAVAPAVLAAAVEYGSVLQQTTGTTTTLRANLLGVGRLALGSRQFPACAIDATCSPLARGLRAVSGSAAFETVKAATALAPVDTGGAVTAAPLLGDDYRIASWGVRLDLTSKDDLQAPAYTKAWKAVLDRLQQEPALVALSNAGLDVVKRFVALPVYAAWQERTARLLLAAPDAAAMRQVLQAQLDELVGSIDQSDLGFAASIAALVRSNTQFIEARNVLLQQMHAHRMSLEYTNRQPIDQPETSNVRFIYSHQPTTAPAVVTLNAALSWYDSKPAAAAVSQFRDLQVAGQVDRRLGEFKSLGDAVISFAGYYQWMPDDAVITLGPGSVAPGSSILLPESAATVLGTQGHIGVAQFRLSLSINPVVRVPLSVTLATRRELIREEDVRGQIGLTLDLDQVLR